MTIPQLCEKMKAQLGEELPSAASEEARCEILVTALYEFSRSIVSAMQRPSRSESYLKEQQAALDLVSVLGAALLREAQHNGRAVAVLVEIAEGCADPQLQKKLSLCAAELRGKGEEAVRGRREGRGANALLVAGAVAAFGGLYYVVPGHLLRPTPTAKTAEASQRENATPLGLPGNLAPPPARGEAQTAAASASAEAAAPTFTVSAEGSRGEQVTKITVVGNQVLVPVVMRNAGQCITLNLLLDTGASRTALRESFAPRLGIDLSRARQSVVELADGRELRCHRAAVELVGVGPQGAASLELEFYPYSGGRDGYDGLLGMDFLAHCRYQLDVENEVIRWY